jgi:hypothetical protein
MRIARVLAVMTLVAFWPATAHAARSWFGWLEELSGPGPFWGVVQTVEVLCWEPKKDKPEETQLAWCKPFGTKPIGPRIERDDQLRRYIEFSFGKLTSRDYARFKDLEGTSKQPADNHESVTLYPLGFTYMLRPHKSLDIGAGAVVHLLRGTNVDVDGRLLLVPVTGSWKFLRAKDNWPSNRFSRALGFDFQVTYLTKGYTGVDFHNTDTTFKSGRELRLMGGLSLDFSDIR